MSREMLPRVEEGGQTKTTVVDVSSRELLIEILSVLKKIEYHLSLATDADLTKE